MVRTGAAALNDVQWIQPKPTFNFTGRVSTSFKLSLLPRTCRVSKKNLWFKMAYRVRHIYYGYNGETVHEDRWYNKNEYLKLRLMV